MKSLYEEITKAIKKIPDQLTEEAIGEIFGIIERYLKEEKRALLSFRAVQAIDIHQSDDYIIIDIYLVTIEVWVKIYKDGYVDVSVYPIQRCECG